MSQSLRKPKDPSSVNAQKEMISQMPCVKIQQNMTVSSIEGFACTMQSEPTEANQQCLVAIQRDKPQFVFDFASIAEIYNSLGSTYEDKKKRPSYQMNQKVRHKSQFKSKKEHNKKEQKERKQAYKLECQLSKLLQPESVNRVESIVKEYQESLKDIYTLEGSQGITGFRCRKKIELFKYVMVAYVELERDKQVTTQAAQTIEACKQNLKGHIVGIVFDIDEAMMKYTNSSLRTLSRQMQNRWSVLLKNMADPDNTDLRRKIITGLYTPLEIVTMEEFEFYTQDKKMNILSKKKEYLQNFTIHQQAEQRYQQYDECLESNNQYFPQISDSASVASNKSNNVANLKKVLRDLLLMGIQIPKKMKQRLTNELINNETIKNELLRQYQRTFSDSIDESHFKGYEKYSFIMDWRYVQVRQEVILPNSQKQLMRKQKTGKGNKKMKPSSLSKKEKKPDLANYMNSQWPEMNQIMPKAQQYKVQEEYFNGSSESQSDKREIRQRMNFKVEEYGDINIDEDDTKFLTKKTTNAQVRQEETSDSE